MSEEKNIVKTEVEELEAIQALKADSYSSEEAEGKESVEALDSKEEKEIEEVEADMYEEDEIAPLSKNPIDKETLKETIRKEKEEALDKIAKASAVEKEELLEEGLIIAGKKAKKSMYRDDVTVPIGEKLSFIPQEEIRKKEYFELVRSQKAKAVLSGKVIATSYISGNLVSIIRYGEGTFDIYIPYAEMNIEKDVDAEYIKKNPKAAEKHMRGILNRRIRSDIDFIVLGIDEEKGVAIASRKEAMKRQKELWYFGRKKDRSFLLEQGKPYEARIVSSNAISCIVECHGIEQRLTPKDISYRHIQDVSKEFPVGKTVKMTFPILERSTVDGKKQIRIKMSIKEASADPRLKYFDRYKTGSCVSAIVSGFAENGIYCRIEDVRGQIDIKCDFSQYDDRGLPSIGDEVLCIITAMNPEELKIRGEIVHTLREAN